MQTLSRVREKFSGVRESIVVTIYPVFSSQPKSRVGLGLPRRKSTPRRAAPRKERKTVALPEGPECYSRQMSRTAGDHSQDVDLESPGASGVAEVSCGGRARARTWCVAARDVTCGPCGDAEWGYARVSR